MTGQLYISLLNPGIGLLLAVAFFLLWNGRRDQTYVGIAAAAYFASMTAFLIQDVGPTLPHDLQRIPANAFFLLSAYGMCAAILGRFGLRPPPRTFALICVAGLVGLCWFLLVQPSLAGRIHSINAAIGTLVVLTVVQLRPHPMPRMLDRLLFWILVAAAANFILRPFMILYFAGGYGSQENFQQSVYWSTVQFTQAMLSVAIALNLMVAVASDLIEDLRREAGTDQLSGLLNRRGFEQHAAAELARSSGPGRTDALLVADLDHFKAINDAHGHAAGDTVIMIFGDLLRDLAGPDAISGRIGGEEFAILLPDADLGRARILAEQIRTALALKGAGRLPEGLRPSASFGIRIRRDREDLYALLRDADTALYQAKKAGRDRVQIFGHDRGLATAGA